jgi:4-hydroxy-3-polyprenylbenzoate decarboxylase
VNKDTEMHPLVRWQYRGGLPESEWRAFLFENVVDARGRRLENRVLIGGLAANPEVYAVGLNCEVDEIGARWEQALSNPIPPEILSTGPVHDVVLGPETFGAEGGGFDGMPIPISTPGFDNAPYLTSAHAVSKDSHTGVRNIGNYRGQIKSPTTCGLFFTGSFKHGYMHWKQARDEGKPLEVALVIGAPPVVSYASVQRVPYGLDEYDVAGGLAGAPIPLVKCKTVDLEVPADSEIVMEGLLHTDRMELEGPFGESHGYIHPRSNSPVFELTCVTHRKDYIWTSFISQVTPSESSVIKRVGLEPLLKTFLREALDIDTVHDVVTHEPLTNLRPVVFVRFEPGAPETEVWRALKGVAAYRSDIGKIVVAVDRDIDPRNVDAILWSLAYRCRPHKDVQILRGQYKGHGPPFTDDPARNEDANLLINATLRDALPPVSLPTREYMEGAQRLWESLGLPALTPQSPWHGYVLSPEEWPAELEMEAKLAVEGRHYETGAKLAASATSADGDAWW